MLKVMTLFLKRPDMTRRQFRDYYEGNHVAMGLAANRYFGFTKYVRNHVVGAHASPPARPFPEFDAFSEYTFKDVDAAVKAQEYMLTPGGKALAEDELNFLDMSYHPSFAVAGDAHRQVPRAWSRPGLRGKVAHGGRAAQRRSHPLHSRKVVQAYAQQFARAMPAPSYG